MTNKEVDRKKDISDYIFVSKYARTINGRKETWDEAVSRVMTTHWDNFPANVKENNRFKELFFQSFDSYKNKEFLGAQRALQFGGEQLLKHQTRMYNCCSSYLNRVEFFKEAMYLLLSGAGVGYSVQYHHISQLPVLEGVDYSRKKEFTIPDSIEGWSEAIDELILSYYEHKPVVEFDYTQIRKKGAYISGGFKAPGYAPLKKAIESIREILDNVGDKRQLTSFELHRIMCLIADSVISGGVRRSAMICLFSPEDKEMRDCKTKDWFYKYPELTRCNNSVAILPDTPKEMYDKTIESAKVYGEPGVVFLKNKDYLVNPCAEIGMYPQIKDQDGNIEYGWSFCNLVTINGGRVLTLEDWKRAATSATVLATIQATYTDFKVLSPITEIIAKRDSLIGVGIGGMYSNPEVIFNPENQKEVAEHIVKINKEVAEILGINPAARTTCVKPDGNSSQLLGTSSGINPFHFKKYIRNIQANNSEKALKIIKEINPVCVEEQVGNGETTSVVSYPIIAPSNSIARQDCSTLDFLEKIKLTQQNWIEYGTNFDHPSMLITPDLRMNVSNTVTVKDHEWEIVREYLWKNREYFCGISLFRESGDLDYPQAPYTSYLDEVELVTTYGQGAILSSGLVVDALNIFDNIWQACDAATGVNKSCLSLTVTDISSFIYKNMENDTFLATIDGVSFSDVNCVLNYLKEKFSKRNDWVRRFHQFSINYFEGDNVKCSKCLKHVNVFHKWQKISKMKPINWNSQIWEENLEDAGSQIGTACVGGMCEI